MKPSLARILALSLSLSLQSAFPQAIDKPCAKHFHNQTLPTVARPLSEIKSLRIMTYNLLNLFLHVGKFDPSTLAMVAEPKGKDLSKTIEIAKIILENDPDIFIAQEVEGLSSAQEFNRLYLNDEYEPMIVHGNDRRSIEICIFVKKDLPFDYVLHTHKDEKWVDPTTLKEELLFSRDLPILEARLKGTNQPVFFLAGTHFKSKRDRKGDPQSEILRGEQVKRAAKIINQIYQKHGEKIPVFLGGDFNGAMNFEGSYASLWKEAKLEDAFNVSEKTKNSNSILDRTTHTFHSKDGNRYGQIDAILLSNCLKNTVQDAFVYRYKENGELKPIPRTYADREENPSDHFPVVVTIDFQKMLKECLGVQ